MRILTGLFIVVFLIAVGVVTFVYSGVYNVAASVPHNRIVAWFLHETKHSSVERRAGKIERPSSDEQVRAGAGHFARSCVYCHGAPGAESAAWARGLRPAPPELDTVTEHWDAGQLAWIVKNGIRMTGMPAFGETHSDEEILAVVAFLEKLPDMTPERYEELSGESPAPAAAGSGS